jgi:hypothetical protein
MEGSVKPGGQVPPSGVVTLAGAFFILAALLAAIDGLVALLDPQAYVPPRRLLFGHHSLWGVLDLIVAGIEASIGLAILNRMRGGQIAGLIIATLAIIEQFAYLAHDSPYAIILIVVNAIVIYALTVHGDEFV